jgi:uncharacterized membrane protein (UPF0127 family)
MIKVVIFYQILMKKVKLLLLIFCILCISVLLLPIFSQSDKDKRALWENYQVAEYDLSGKKLRLIIADTEEKREKGLMFIKKPIEGVDGMMFVFPKATNQSFWNKNTYMDLTLYWLNGKEVVGESQLPSITDSNKIVVVSSPSPADTVIELY